VGADGPVRDLDGAYARWFAETGAAVALQRPDFYVFGAAPARDDGARLVADLRAALSAP
jgi:3-(3-hydroxy-phenyl)propionate hydroxylase